MVGSYSNNAFGSGFPQPTGMGNGYRRNPASTRQNQIGNGPNPTGAQTVGQMQPLPGAYGQQGQMQQASGMQPLDTQSAMFNLFKMMKKQRSNVYQPQQEQQYQLTGLPQEQKTFAADLVDRHMEGDEEGVAEKQQAVTEAIRKRLQQAQQAQQAPLPQNGWQPDKFAPRRKQNQRDMQQAPQEARKLLEIAQKLQAFQQSGRLGNGNVSNVMQAPPQRAMAPHDLMELGAENLTKADWEALIDQTMIPGAKAADEEEFIKYVQDNPQSFPTDSEDSREVLEYILKLDPAKGNVPVDGTTQYPRRLRQRGAPQQQQAQQPQQPNGGASGGGQPQQGDELPQNGWQPGKAYTDLTPDEKEQLLQEKRATLGGLNAATAKMRGLSAEMRIAAAPDMARREEVERNYAQQIAASEGSLAYQQGQTGNVPGLAGMRTAQARQDFRDGTPGGRQMDRFDKLLAQRGQQPQQGQYQSNVEQPTKNSQDALERYYDDGDKQANPSERMAPMYSEFTNDVGQKMLIKKRDGGGYSLTGKGERTPEDVARIADERQERIANASPALQKRARDTAMRRGQPRGNAVSNAMLRKQGLSPEQISNVYAGTEDKETTQMMRQPQSAVELRQDRLPGGGRSGPRTDEAVSQVGQLDAIATGAVDPATGVAAPATEDQQYTVGLLGELGFDTPSEVTAYEFAESMRSAAATSLQSLAPDDKLKAARTLHRFILNKINSSKKGNWSETGAGWWGWSKIDESDSANIEAAEPIAPDNDTAVLAWFDRLMAKPAPQEPISLGPRQRFNKSQ